METTVEKKYTVGSYISGYVSNMVTALKNPRTLIISLLLTVLVSEAQFLLAMMTARGDIKNPFAVISLLLYANGGMYGGVIGVAGGVLGKMLLMMFLNSVVLGWDMHEKPLGSFASGIGKSFSALAFKRLYDLSGWLFGAGTALLIYWICNITQNRMNCMIGAYLLVMLIGSLGKKNSFLYGLMLHLFFGRRMEEAGSAQTVTSLMGGSAAGYLTGTILSAAGLQICMQIGALLLVPALLFFVLGLLTKH
jgi:hypothetical protein